MTGFPEGPGVDLSGVLTPDSRCGRLARALGKVVRLANGLPAQLSEPERALVDAHLRQLRFAGDRFSAAAAENMQVSQGNGNAEFRGPGDPACSESKPARCGTAEAARILEMTPRSVLNLIYRGSLQGTRSARGWIVDMGSVAELYEQRRKENEESKAA